jgi:hypothetical protein
MALDIHKVAHPEKSLKKLYVIDIAKCQKSQTNAFSAMMNFHQKNQKPLKIL